MTELKSGPMLRAFECEIVINNIEKCRREKNRNYHHNDVTLRSGMMLLTATLLNIVDYQFPLKRAMG